MATTTPSVNFLMEILPSLELLSNAFPLLTEDIVNLLFGELKTLMCAYNISAVSPSTGVAKGTIGYLRNPQLAEQISSTFDRITKKLLSRGQS